jgi:hypothetical protein
MKIEKQITIPGLFFTLLLLMLQCSKDDVTEVNKNKDALSINNFFKEIPEWDTPEKNTMEDIYKDSVIVEGEIPEESYECPVFERHIISTIKNFISVGTNFGIIWPGAIIQGKSLKTGDLKLLNVTDKRAPITLTTNLPLSKTSITITPNSSTAQQAIADFMIAAGEMPEGSQAGAGILSFHVEEATTFKQSMLQMGISAGFTEPESSVGLEGSLTVEQSRKQSTHTVVAKFIQEMFTVRVADDLIPTPSDFFSTDFSIADLENLEDDGEIGDDNIPVYIESVTYGRIMVFSLKSETVSSANKLISELEASMADYAKLGGEYSDEHEEIFSTASHRVFSAGGTDDAANAAIASLDWSRFFVKSPASAAVPISFVAKTLNGRKIVSLLDSTSVIRRDDCSLIEIIEPAEPEIASYDIAVEWTETNNTGLCFGGGEFGFCSPKAFLKPEQDYVFSSLTIFNGYQRAFKINIDDEVPYYKFTVRSMSSLKLPLGAYSTKTQANTYDVRNLKEGNTTIRHTLSNYAGSVTLTYRITKLTNYR